MKSERWQQVKAILDAAHDVDARDRTRLLAESYAGDEELRREVESLLGYEASAAEFIEESALARAAQSFAEDEEIDAAGRRIGQYVIEREIGRGGMGVVYLAARANDYTQRVAIKVIKRGMDTDFILRRFRTERQILASLEHPNIARLLDGGTTEDGLPFFVMEYVEGVAIDDYCAAHHLSIEERLGLFLDVCAAVSYAHRHLVVHRDLKPSNILVTADGAPKLLDFGIAKLVDADKAQATETAMRLMTPEYAAPEQARGASVTTASDVYALGVVLYELLAGQRPYNFTSRSAEEIRRLITEREPVPPSAAVSRAVSRAASTHERADAVSGEAKDAATNPASEAKATNRISDDEGERRRWHRRLRGDLDNIVLMAMRKEPARRYASVEHFAEDIRRHLQGLIVRARPDTLHYRATKFVGRNRVGVIAASLVLCALLVGMTTSVWQARVAQAERARAENRFHDMRRLTSALVTELNDEIERSPTRARMLLAARASEYLNIMAQEAGDDRSLARELAIVHLKLGDIQGQPYRSNLGDIEEALTNYRQAMRLLESLSVSDTMDGETQSALATVYERIGRILWRQGERPMAREYKERALRMREALLASDPSNIEYRRRLADSYIHIGGMMISGDDPGAATVYRELAGLDERSGNIATALENYRSIVDLRRRFATDALSPLGDDLAIAYTDFARLSARRAAELTSPAARTAQWREAREAYQQSLNIWRALRDANNPRPDAADRVSEIARCDEALTG